VVIFGLRPSTMTEAAIADQAREYGLDFQRASIRVLENVSDRSRVRDGDQATYRAEVRLHTEQDADRVLHMAWNGASAMGSWRIEPFKHPGARRGLPDTDAPRYGQPPMHPDRRAQQLPRHAAANATERSQ
jgi:hypothetical protein